MKSFTFQPALLALIGYLGLSLIMTWPLITHLHGYVPGLGDWGQNMWALWWTRHALLTGQNPFYTHTLFYPDGVTLLFHPLDVADGLLGLPLYALLGSDVTYNLLVLVSFIFSGYGAYLLALHLTHNRPASFIAGLIFTFSPYHFLRLELGHLNLATMQWLPFYLLFTLKALTPSPRPSPRWEMAIKLLLPLGEGRGEGKSLLTSHFSFLTPYSLLAIFFLALTALHSWYYVIYLGLITVAMLVYPTQTTLRHRLIIISFILGTTLLILSPLIIPMAQLLSSTKLIGEHNPLRHSVDLMSFWLPGPPSTWAAWFSPMWQPYAAQNREPGASAYFSYTVLLLSLLGLLKAKKINPHPNPLPVGEGVKILPSPSGRGGEGDLALPLWWSLIALIFALFALGPQLQLNGQIYPITLPYGILNSLIPAFALTGIPGRFIIITSLALAMLAAYGLVKIGTNRYLLILCGLLILIEYAAIPMRLTSTALPEFYQQLADDHEHYAILDIKWDANFLMHAQTVHGKPLIGGWLARLPQEQAAYLDEPSLDKAFLRLMLGADGLALTDPAEIQIAIQSALKTHQVRYIITHTPTARPFLAQWVGWPIVYEDDELVVYGK